MDDITIGSHPGSYKDPDAYVIIKEGKCFRVITPNYKNQYNHLMQSGLYSALVDDGLLVSHSEQDLTYEGSYKVLLPQQIPFISYPYEWSFNQLRDAAILTLDIQLKALEHGMTLKDASAYNVQYIGPHPVFIDSSSFELLNESKPWVAYGQFCRHFLAPLALMSYTDLRLSSMQAMNLDGIPLDLCVKLLPFRTKLNLGLFTHLHLHAKTVKSYEVKNKQVKTTQAFTLKRLVNIIKHLKLTVESLHILGQKTVWDDYYANNNNYTEKAFKAKADWISQQLDERKESVLTVWDMGANDGTFSRIPAGKGMSVVAMDIDSNAVDFNYLTLKTEAHKNILPLVIDLANPSPATGWNTEERESIFQRPKPDLILALALVHHLAIGLNVPLSRVASFFAQRSNKYLLIEFVAPEDSQVKKLLVNRQDQFKTYNESNFRASFLEYFEIEAEHHITESHRTLFLFKKK